MSVVPPYLPIQPTRDHVELYLLLKKSLHVTGPVQFKPELLRDQLDFIVLCVIVCSTSPILGHWNSFQFEAGINNPAKMHMLTPATSWVVVRFK